MPRIVEQIISYLPHGSFEFTPEGYAKAAFWMPEDGFTWKYFRNQSFSSYEDLETKKAEFELHIRGKLEVVDRTYFEGTLRTIFPDRWVVSYTRDGVWQKVNGKKVPIYLRLKNNLLFKSVILGYGEGPIHEAIPSNEVALYIKQHCASSARLKAIALRAYESLTNVRGYTTWTSVSPPIFLCLAAAKSSMDAMSAVLWSLLFHKLPDGRLPSMGTLYWDLRNQGHAFSPDFAKLYDGPWFKSLEKARDSVIHRSASPVAHDKFGAAFDFDLGLFGESGPSEPRVALEDNMKLLHLDSIMGGFVNDLEEWENSIADKLQELAWFPSLNTEGVIMGLDFNDNRLLRDGSGPSLMINSHAGN